MEIQVREGLGHKIWNAIKIIILQGTLIEQKSSVYDAVKHFKAQ